MIAKLLHWLDPERRRRDEKLDRLTNRLQENIEKDEAWTMKELAKGDRYKHALEMIARTGVQAGGTWCAEAAKLTLAGGDPT